MQKHIFLKLKHIPFVSTITLNIDTTSIEFNELPFTKITKYDVTTFIEFKKLILKLFNHEQEEFGCNDVDKIKLLYDGQIIENKDDALLIDSFVNEATYTIINNNIYNR